MQVVIVLLLILAVLLVIFTLQNSMEITIHVLFWEIPKAPLVLVILCCIIVGYIISVVYFYPRLWKLKKENNRLKKINAKFNKLRESDSDKKTVEEDDSEEDIDPDDLEMDDDEDDSFFKD